MGAPGKDGFSEQAVTHAVAYADFIQAERDRLRAGLLDQPPVKAPDDPRLAEALRLPSPTGDGVSGRALGTFGEIWRTRHQGALKGLPHGTCVTVDLASGLWFTAEKRWAAYDRRDEVLGKGRTGWSFEHGIPLTLGSGLWALHSEA